MKSSCAAATAAVFALLLSLLTTAGRAEQQSCPSAQELLNTLTAAEKPADSALLAAPPAGKSCAAERYRGEAVGKVQTVEGTVLILSADGCGASRLRKSLPLPVFNGDTLVTAANSRVTLLLEDESRLTLAAQSRMTIERAVSDPAARRRDTRLRLALGRLRAVVSKMTGKNFYRIQTPAATAGVRGTDFALAVTSSRTVLLTGGGSSTVKLTDRKGGSVMVGPLAAATAETGCPVCPPARVGRKALTALHEIAPELDSEPARDCWPIRWSCN